MPVLLFTICIVGSIALITYMSIWLYNMWREHKYGPLQKDIGFEGSRFRILRYLSSKATTVNRLNVIEDLEINVPDFKRVINSLNRDKLIKTGPQSIKITPFGQQYHDVFLKKGEHGSEVN
jgi:hypothetical protein